MLSLVFLFHRFCVCLWPITSICGAFIIWAGTSGCSFFKEPVLLQIGSRQWTSKEFVQLLSQKIKKSATSSLSPLEVEQAKKNLVSDLLIQQIVQDWAKRYQISVSKQELQVALQNIRSSYFNATAFNMYLNRRKIDRQLWEKSVWYNLLVQKVTKHISQDISPPSEEEIKNFYQQYPENFKTKQRIRIYHIFQLHKEPLFKIQKLIKQGEDFKSLARQFSVAPQKEKLQWVEKGVLKVFDKAFSLKTDQVSPIWPSAYGFHIIKVVDKQKSRSVSFEQAKPSIIRILIQKRRQALFTKWLDEQAKTVSVFQNQEMMRKIKVQPL